MMALEKHAATAAHWSVEQYRAVFSSAGTPRIALVIEDADAIQGFLIARAVGSRMGDSKILPSPARPAVAAWEHGCWESFLTPPAPHGAKAVFLEVRESNPAARRLYEKWAFVESGRRRRYYRILRRMRDPVSP